MTSDEVRACLLRDMGRSDYYWQHYTFHKDPLSSVISPEDRGEILGESIRTAHAVFRSYEKKYAGCSAWEWPVQFALTLERRPAYEPWDTMLYIALYLPSERKIILQDEALKTVGRFISQNRLGDLFSVREMEAIALYHEIFHHIERITPGIYTTSRLLPKKRFGFIKYTAFWDVPGEAAAVEFSRLMAKSRCHPCVYEKLLLMACNAG